MNLIQIKPLCEAEAPIDCAQTPFTGRILLSLIQGSHYPTFQGEAIDQLAPKHSPSHISDPKQRTLTEQHQLASLIVCFPQFTLHILFYSTFKGVLILIFDAKKRFVRKTI
jgi:hypothetical protein